MCIIEKSILEDQIKSYKSSVESLTFQLELHKDKIEALVFDMIRNKRMLSEQTETSFNNSDPNDSTHGDGVDITGRTNSNTPDA